MSRKLRMLFAGLVAVAGMALGPALASAQDIYPSPGGTILAPETYTKHGSATHLAMQSDGNLALYHGQTPLWASNTHSAQSNSAYAVMQSDGNLVVYDTQPTKHALWSSGTNNHPNDHLAVQTDGNVVIYDGGAIFSTHTNAINSPTVNDYPASLGGPGANPPVALDALIDPWRFWNRECTSFVAWRLNHNNGIAFWAGMNGGWFGNAGTWGSNAQKLGYTVNATPTAGSVAEWGYGHVAYVDSVNSDGTANIEQYNVPRYSGNYSYVTHVIADHYIHFPYNGF